jgi:DNA-binding transcriptional LysR family regulator
MSDRLLEIEAGASYLERARGVLLELGEAAAVARGGGLQGVLRVALPVAFGSHEVVPRLAPFLAAHPQLKVEFLMADRHQNLVEEGVDLALRLGPLPDSSLVARRLASAPRWPVAATTYLAGRGEPATPLDLAGHDCVLGPLGATPAHWVFQAPSGQAIAVKVQGRVRLDSAAGVLACLTAGLGIGIASLWMCRAELAAGTLVQLLPGYRLEPAELFAVFPAGRRASSKAGAFADHLEAALRLDRPADRLPECH